MPAETANPTSASSPPTERLPKWKIGASDFGIFAALLFSSMVVVSSLFAKITLWILGAEAGPQQPLLATLAGNLGMQAGMLLAYLAFMKLICPPTEAESQPARVPAGPAIGIGLKWLAFSYPVLIAINLGWQPLLEWLGFEKVTQDPVKLVLEGGAAVERVFIYSMIVLVAPLCEEPVFRGAIFRYLHHRVHLFAALAVSAFLFALIHINLYSFAPLMVIGVTLALAYRESGSILSPIAFHAAFNTINLLLILRFPDLQ